MKNFQILLIVTLTYLSVENTRANVATITVPVNSFKHSTDPKEYLRSIHRVAFYIKAPSSAGGKILSISPDVITGENDPVGFMKAVLHKLSGISPEQIKLSYDVKELTNENLYSVPREGTIKATFHPNTATPIANTVAITTPPPAVAPAPIGVMSVGAPPASVMPGVAHVNNGQ